MSKVRYHCSGKKGQVTILGCASATGQALPPFITFDAQQLNLLWTRGEIPGTQYGLSKSGWTDSELFNGWLKEHFMTHAVKGRPLLLLLDDHSSHFDSETIKFAKERNSFFAFPARSPTVGRKLFWPTEVSLVKCLSRILSIVTGKSYHRVQLQSSFLESLDEGCVI